MTFLRRTVVHAPLGRVTHRPAEVQGYNVLTTCGLTLEGYSVIEDAPFPTCKRCARKI